MSISRARPPLFAGLFALFAILTGLVLLPAPALAASTAEPQQEARGEVSWGIQPSTPEGPDGRDSFMFTVDPGTNITDWVRVTNDSEDEVTFRVYASDATTDYDTGSFTLIGADQPSTGMGFWTSVDGTASACPDAESRQEQAGCAAGLGVELSLASGEAADIPFTIAVPEDATPGDHSAGIVASFRQESASDDSLQYEQRVGTRIYLRVGGPLSPGLSLSGAVGGYDGSWNPVGPGTGWAGFDITNTGNTRISVLPELHFTGPFGLDLGTVALPAVRHIVPGGVAHVRGEQPNLPPLGLITTEITATPATEPETLPDDPVAGPVTAEATAWAIPWSLLAVIVLVGAAVWLLVFNRRRRRRDLAEELNEYTERVRAEALSEARTGAGTPQRETIPASPSESEQYR